MKKRLSVALATVAAGVLFAFPAGAAAQECDGPTGDQYCEPTDVLTASGSASSDPGDPDAAGGLPFTGLDLGLAAIAGGVLLGAGVALRRTTSA
jgi:hypothetical protein